MLLQKVGLKAASVFDKPVGLGRYALCLAYHMTWSAPTFTQRSFRQPRCAVSGLCTIDKSRAVSPNSMSKPYRFGPDDPGTLPFCSALEVSSCRARSTSHKALTFF